MKRIALIIVMLVAICGNVCAQKRLPADAKTTQINLPGWCCNSLNPTIEKTLAYEKGVVSWTLEKDQKQVTVVYRSNKTTPVKIEKALSENGVRTEHYAANQRAVKELPKCCQPSNRGEGDGCKH